LHNFTQVNIIILKTNITNVPYNFQKGLFSHFYFVAGFFLGFRLKYKISTPMEAYVAFATWQYEKYMLQKETKKSESLGF
jgi:hypothetical protein